MASMIFCLLSFIALYPVEALASPPNNSAELSNMYPFSCSNSIPKCNSFLYQHNNVSLEEATVFFSVNASQIRPFTRNRTQDYLVFVPCSCQDVNGTTAYFYDTQYEVQQGDTFFGVANAIYSGQAWNDEEGGQNFIAGENATIHLLCGCSESGQSLDEVVVTYTVQEGDTLFSIAELLSSHISEIQKLNRNLANNPSLLEVGWVLYLPMKNSTQNRFLRSFNKGQS